MVKVGSVDRVLPNPKLPIDVVCQPATIASGTQNLAYGASSVNSFSARREQPGDDTDYAAALGQAMS